MPIVPPNWAGRDERSRTAALTSKDVAEARAKLGVEAKAGDESLSVLELLKMFELYSNNPKALLGALIDKGDALIDFLVTTVTGLNIPDGTVKGALTGTTSNATRAELGGILLKLFDETLDVSGVQTGFYNRDPGDTERGNFKRIVGAAFRMQLGDMVTDWASQAVPFGLADGLKDIAERIDRAINLDDGLEELIQVFFQQLVTRGMEAYYNRLIKPVDLTNGEARQALIAERIDKATYDKVLDNSGLRDDIRETLLDFAASNLTESDINEAYQHNLLSREEVKEQYKNKFFQEPDRELKTKLVEGTRRWKLQEKVFELYGNLYRDGVATREEIKPFLDNYGYDPDEQEMWFNVQELERRQRKWISDTNLLKLVTAGTITVSSAIAYLQLQGMEAVDAINYMTLALKQEKEDKAATIERKAKAVIAKLPKPVRDKCQDLFSPEKILGELLSEVIALIPLGGIDLADIVELRDIIECALKAIAGTPAPPPTP